MYQSWREWPTRSICRSVRASRRTVRRTTRAVRPAPARRAVRARAARTRWIAIRVRRAAAAIRSVSAPGRTAATVSNEISVTVRPDRRVYLSCGLRTIVVFGWPLGRLINVSLHILRINFFNLFYRLGVFISFLFFYSPVSRCLLCKLL